MDLSLLAVQKDKSQKIIYKKLIKMSNDLYKNSVKLQELFETAHTDPRVYNTPDAKLLIQQCYAKLTEATALKAEIDKEELARFQTDNSTQIVKLKSNFEKMDPRGLSAYMVMPYQRAARYPMLFKAILDPISHKDEDSNLVAPLSDKYPEWKILNKQLKDFNALAKQVNESLVQRTPVVSMSSPIVQVNDWISADPKEQTRSRKESSAPLEQVHRRAPAMAWQAVQHDKRSVERGEHFSIGKRSHVSTSTADSEVGNNVPSKSPEHKRRNTDEKSKENAMKKDMPTTRKKL
ncbi:MAG: hypothetical protein AB7D28_06065 [Candidatus Berkiella sp.]